MPDENGSGAPRVAAAATAASAALPPARSTSRPALVASRSTVDTAPPYPTATASLPSTDLGVGAAVRAPAGAAVPITVPVATAARTARVRGGRIAAPEVGGRA